MRKPLGLVSRIFDTPGISSSIITLGLTGISYLIFQEHAEELKSTSLYLEDLIEHITTPAILGSLTYSLLKINKNKRRHTTSNCFRHFLLEKYLGRLIKDRNNFTIITGKPHFIGNQTLSDNEMKNITQTLKNRLGDTIFCDATSTIYIITDEKNEKEIYYLSKELEEEHSTLDKRFTFAYDLVDFSKDEETPSIETLITRANKNLQLRSILDLNVPSGFRTLLNGLSQRDPITYIHTKGVREYSMEIGKIVGVESRDILAISVSSLLHDLGKIGVFDKILLSEKELKRDEEEFEPMKRHPIDGYIEAVSSYPLLAEELRPVLEHHRRYDNEGYPTQKCFENYLRKPKEFEISPNLENYIINCLAEEPHIYSKIVSIADTIEAMTGKRQYRPPKTLEQAKEELIKFSNSQFDPKLVEKVIENWHRIENVYRNLNGYQ